MAPLWNRKPQPVEVKAELVKVEPVYEPRARFVDVADWTITFDDDTTITIQAAYLSDSEKYMYVDDGNGWASASRIAVKELLFYDTIWGRSDIVGKPTSRLVAQIRADRIHSVIASNWRTEDRGVW
jgi:hypothetical protein